MNDCDEFIISPTKEKIFSIFKLYSRMIRLEYFSISPAILSMLSQIYDYKWWQCKLVLASTLSHSPSFLNAIAIFASFLFTILIYFSELHQSAILIASFVLFWTFVHFSVVYRYVVDSLDKFIELLNRRGILLGKINLNSNRMNSLFFIISSSLTVEFSDVKQ